MVVVMVWCVFHTNTPEMPRNGWSGLGTKLKFESFVEHCGKAPQGPPPHAHACESYDEIRQYFGGWHGCLDENANTLPFNQAKLAYQALVYYEPTSKTIAKCNGCAYISMKKAFDTPPVDLPEGHSQDVPSAGLYHLGEFPGDQAL